MPTQVMSLREAGVYFAPMGPFAKEMRKAAAKGLFSAALRAKQDIVARVIPNQPRVPVDRGIYKAGWQVEKLPDGAAIYNAVPYAIIIENGVPPGNVKAGGRARLNIAEWARRKFGGLDANAAWEVAGRIITAMRKRGIFQGGKGLRILEKYSRDTLPNIIKREVEAELNKVAR
jgi:hypothetical protein